MSIWLACNVANLVRVLVWVTARASTVRTIPPQGWVLARVSLAYATAVFRIAMERHDARWLKHATAGITPDLVLPAITMFTATVGVRTCNVLQTLARAARNLRKHASNRQFTSLSDLMARFCLHRVLPAIKVLVWSSILGAAFRSMPHVLGLLGNSLVVDI